MSGWTKTEAQIVAASCTNGVISFFGRDSQERVVVLTIQIPTCAITAVPEPWYQHVYGQGAQREGTGPAIPITKLNCRPWFSCCEASPALPSKGSSSPRPSFGLSSGTLVAEAMLQEESCRLLVKAVQVVNVGKDRGYIIMAGCRIYTIIRCMRRVRRFS